MNMYLGMKDIDINEHIRYLYSKKNTIMDGNFTKILFSNDYTTMNGLYIILPSLIVTDSTNNNNTRILNANSRINAVLIENLRVLEDSLVKHYCTFNSLSKVGDMVLNRQLKSGQIRVYRDNIMTSSRKYVIKISGIWETAQSVGLTYKINEV